MSWMSQLFRTYENNVGKEQQSDMQMTPIAHMNANAQIEITLSSEGEFRGATQVEKDDAVTLIPVTESSAGRSSGSAPHALCDNLLYIAGDFSSYCEDKKSEKTAKDRNRDYMSNLKGWAESEYSHPKVQAVYRYLSQNVLISDLVKAGLIELKEDHTFENKKISGQPYEKAIVRFRILGSGLESDATWEDVSLVQAYTAYYLEKMQGRTDICYFIGQERTISENNPKGIVAANYGAKLVSANDNQGYTYRGRFQNAEQAFALSYEASQKIHSALTWLAKCQGVTVGIKDKRTFICWNPEGKRVPDIFEEFDLISDETEEALKMPYRKKLKGIMAGYNSQFEESDSVVIMGLDAATTGRLSVTYYHELMASDFLRRVTYWGETCNWFYLKFNEKKKPYYEIQTPIFKRIVECAFGREKGNFIDTDDKVMKEHTQRLVKCMLEDQPIPFDFVQALAVRASTPMAYSGYNREKVLSTACAVIKKYYYYHDNQQVKGEEEYMKLDPDNQERSYLFGRLLAVCEKVERATFEKGETREPNAIRLQSAYVNHPMQTWKVLEGLLNPYFQKLSPGLREYYRNLIAKITVSFREEDIQEMNKGLKETYLLGYYLQRAELNKKKDEKEDKEHE